MSYSSHCLLNKCTKAYGSDYNYSSLEKNIENYIIIYCTFPISIILLHTIFLSHTVFRFSPYTHNIISIIICCFLLDILFYSLFKPLLPSVLQLIEFFMFITQQHTDNHLNQIIYITQYYYALKYIISNHSYLIFQYYIFTRSY